MAVGDAMTRAKQESVRNPHGQQPHGPDICGVQGCGREYTTHVAGRVRHLFLPESTAQEIAAAAGRRPNAGEMRAAWVANVQ